MMSMYQSEMQLAKQICRCANVSVMKGTQTMRITSNGKSIANQLTDILNRTLPRQKDTGLSKDLGVVKVDPKSKVKIFIPLEKRDSREIWPEAPHGIKLENYAFDYVPARFITAFIAEFGLIKPKDMCKIVKKHYPGLF